MPKTDGGKITGILGGTLVRNYIGEDEKLNEAEFFKIYERAKDFFNFDRTEGSGKPKF
jgi:hypothetical protein